MKKPLEVIDSFLSRINEDPTLRTSMPLAVAGQAIQTELSVPRLLRHYLSDLVDGYMFSGILNAAQMSICSAFNKKSISRPATCAAIILGLGMQTEFSQMQDRQAALVELKASGKFETTKNPPSPEYDWADVFCYAASIGVYVLRHKRKKVHPDIVFEPEHP